jgi:hypothetical protein
MRRLSLALVAAALWATPAFATIAVDPTNAAINISCTGTVTTCQTTTAFTAAQSNELLVALAACGQAANTSATVTSLSDNGPGLVWTKRTDQTSGHNYQSVWTAQAVGSFSAKLTANYTGCASGDAIVAIFGVQGAPTSSPWDSNVALPAKSTGSSSVPTTGPISTTNANTLLLSFGNGFANIAAPTGWTHVPGANNINNLAGCCASQGQIDYKIVSSTQSSVTATYGTSETAWLTIGDAIDQAPFTGVHGSLMMLDVGQ